ncbi:MULTISPECIES: sigma-70 family RNA polymerase sigma factor [unclassified Coleofasciculus]|uniref:sigma-70 family RNA polymerase sigma factor n=1 Tax=unclassified Coleofasciculus TaxID=2692782 RepID=UPI00187FC769|nr:MULTISPECIES: sigma-70 family RNA polymerase sigma factor [unclassified Coleofasciculus]MBE9129697.1 sigma-70 family RNA polymerase sigma factor [Coleofasciculus sp. LEGE 07081]MBE9149546.1 sigma-70 family RNA polymerase sigma factor [Coleofasciculus sp. LEGE 07092]
MSPDLCDSGAIVPPQSDTELFLTLKAGQATALGVLYDRYAGLVYGLALKILVNPEEAADLTQDVFLYLWYQANYDPARGSFHSFLMTLTRSRAIDRLRTRTIRFRFLQRWRRFRSTEASSITPMDKASVLEQSQKIQAAMAQLSEEERQVLELAYYSGLSQSEIAEQLNIPLGTVKSRSRRGLLKLRQVLQNFDGLEREPDNDKPLTS